MYGDAFPRCNLNFGPGIVAGFLGAQVRPTALTTWFEPSVELELQDIHPRFDPDNPWLVRMAEQSPRCRVVTTGSHFRIYHRHGRQFTPLLLPEETLIPLEAPSKHHADRTPEPFAIPAACFSRAAAGGLFVTNSKVRSL